MRIWRQGGSCLFQNGNGEFAAYRREIVEEDLKRVAGFEMVEQRLDGNRPTNAVIDGGPVQMSTSGRSKPNPTRQV